MTPLEFLNVEFGNVRRVLQETLRHDYGPAHSGDYYDECDLRLKGIEANIPGIVATDAKTIYAYLQQLLYLTSFVTLIERSQLGEFSWPFSYELREIADVLLTEKNLNGPVIRPIVHVIAEGQDYKIVYEPQVPMVTSERRFVVIAFPRSLKHYVLLHTLFGHELGHSAIFTTTTGSILTAVATALIANSPLCDLAQMNVWVHSANAPGEVKAELAKHLADTGQAFAFTNQNRISWLIELICDVFGFLLFGPAFLAAHRVYLQALSPDVYAVNVAMPTHPPYAVRHKLLVQLMTVSGWQAPITTPADGALHAAETEMLSFLLDDSYGAWAKMFVDADLNQAANAIKGILLPHNLGHIPIEGSKLKTLVARLMKGQPPILGEIDLDGKPALTRVEISQILYAGWVYWLGRQHLAPVVSLDFFKTNRLCDHALLQQRAINYARKAGVV